MLGKLKQFTVCGLVVAVVVCGINQRSWTQSPAGGEVDLVSLIPRKAFFFVERRGHEVVREAFAASNLGKMAADEAINQFVHDSRVRIGQKIVEEMFNLTDEEEIARHHKWLHELLKPFWYRPCAMFALTDDALDSPPALGFICVPGKYTSESKAALANLMKVGERRISPRS